MWVIYSILELLGHVEHGDNNCQDLDLNDPPEGLFILKLFEDPDNFQSLRVIYFEQNCSLTSWLFQKLQEIRPLLKIKFTPGETQWMINKNIFLE